MAEQLTINVILNTLRTRIQGLQGANRAAQLERERRQRVEAEAKRQRKPVEAAKPWPGAVPENRAREDPAAYRNPSGVAVGYGGYTFRGMYEYLLTPGQEIQLWSRNGIGTLVYDLEDIISSNGTDDGLITISFRMYQELLLPISGTELIYCFYAEKWLGSYLANIIDGYNDYGGSMTGAESFCAVVGVSGVRQIDMPASVLTALENAAPDYVWVPGTNYGTIYYIPGQFSPANTADPISARPNALLRFDVGDGAGLGTAAGVYQELGADPVDPPSYALAACQLEATCPVGKYGFDLTRNPDDVTPVYRRYKAADATIPEGRAVDELIAAWDWGRPSYCRQRLLALGFTTADLKP